MFILLAVVLFLPIITAWTGVSLGQKIKANTAYREIGHILIWTPVFCFGWILFSIVVLFNISNFPPSVQEQMLTGDRLETIVLAPVIVSAIATIGAATFAILKSLYSAHAVLTILLCIPVIRTFLTWSSEFFG